MEYSLLALLAIALLFPVAYLVYYLRRRQLREARQRSRQRFHDLVAFDQARRVGEWAAQPAEGVSGIVLLNTVDGYADPLRQAPSSAFAEVAPGIWRSVQPRGGSRGDAVAAAAAAALATAVEGERTRASPSTPQQQASSSLTRPALEDEEGRSPYGSRVHDAQPGEDSVWNRTHEDEDVFHDDDFHGVVGKPVQMEEAPSAAAAETHVSYGEAAYLPRSVAVDSSPSASLAGSVGEGSECAVKPVKESHLPYTPYEGDGRAQ